MKPLDLANRYLEIFYSGKDLERLNELFSCDFSFKGPYFQFESKEDYINSLLEDPPEDCDYKIMHTLENKATACVVYEFTKPGVNTVMTQIFETSDGKISKILLIFDTSGFKQNQ